MKRQVTLMLDVSTREALDRLALREERSRSRLAERLIREGLAARAAELPQIAQPQRPANPATAAA